MTETLDRLKSEKSDLDQEVLDLNRENQDLKREKDESSSNDNFDYALYEETKQNLDETTDKLSQIMTELSSKNNEIQELIKFKEMHESQLNSLQNDLTNLKSSLEESRETVAEKDKTIEDLNTDLENLKTELENTTPTENPELDQLKSDLEEQKIALEQWNTWANEKTEEINVLSADKIELQTAMENLQKELEESKKVATEKEPSEEPVDNALKEEVEQQRKVLEDWNTWAVQKTEEYNQLLEAYNQYVQAHQALEAEIERLKAVNTELEDKIAKTSETLTEVPPKTEDNKAAYEAEIEKLKNEITGLAAKMTIPNEAFTSQFDDKAMLEAEISRLKTENEELKVSKSTEVEAFDDTPAWGAPEDEVLLTSSDNNNALLELEAEISDLKQKIRSEQEEKGKLNEEINAAKVKHGKLTLKVKQLTKELNSRKSASPAASIGDDSLDKAIQDELNQRATKAEKALKDSQQQIQDLVAEKTRLLERVDTLEGGNERFMELKENQDQEVQFLKNQNLQLKNQLGGFEWQLQEKDEMIANLQQDLATHAGNKPFIEIGINLKFVYYCDFC